MKQFICDSCECAKKHGPCILAVPPTEGDDLPVNCPYLDPNSKPDWRDHHPQPIDVLADATFKAELDIIVPTGSQTADCTMEIGQNNTLTLHYEFLPCPFCGGKVYLLEPGFNIICKKDDCDYIYGLSLTMAEDEELSVATKLRLLSERWNKRVTLG